MKGMRFFIYCVLLFMLAMPASGVEVGVISSVSPSSAEPGDTVTLTILGGVITNTTGSVVLRKGSEEIECYEPTSWVYIEPINKVVCKCKIPKNTDTGYWNLVIIRGYDDEEILKSNAFVVSEPVSISSISPATARAGDEDIVFTITGSGFDTDMDYEVFLVLDGDLDDIITSAYSVDPKSSTKITGTFDIDDDIDEDKYDLCIEDEYNVVECDNKAFEVTTNKVGYLEISSSPSGATIYIDNIANGTTPHEIDDLIVGSYKVTLKKSGYQDWGKIVNIYEDETTEIDAKLYAAATATATTAPTTAPTTARTTTPRTTIRSTIKIPTTWVDPVTTTAESPVDPLIIVGAVALAFISLRRH